ncbi:hypothetical protein [Pseudonocardia xinjiangensis]|uniref:Uncharacterized protein n=1 Tax=Pseudonocardia xinjiangensis TaxID=75289 RepID=A0ABX1RJ68_9PSEU|nr:hypothetical protein [Pseudonocardia xinjiangensis]NMH79664.1 hypothetical protein [Pseudonocardia xinjiangensis]
MSAPTRERVGRFRILTAAADALRGTHHDSGVPTVACPRCATTVRTRHPLPTAEAAREGSALHSALLDHLFRDCPATEVAR